MNDKSCNSCSAIGVRWSIRSPVDLERIVGRIKAALADGSIVSSGYWPAGLVERQDTAFSAVGDEGWDDILHYYFECPLCGRLFELFAETYHGSGGQWQPVDREMSDGVRR